MLKIFVSNRKIMLVKRIAYFKFATRFFDVYYEISDNLITFKIKK